MDSVTFQGKITCTSTWVDCYQQTALRRGVYQLVILNMMGLVQNMGCTIGTTGDDFKRF